MDRQGLFVIVAAVAVINGIFSPYVGIVFRLAPVWLPELVPPSVAIVAYLSSLIVATATLILSGVPAALYERIAGIRANDTVPMYVWLAAAIVLSLPALDILTRL
jgi:hypothetical protein